MSNSLFNDIKAAETAAQLLHLALQDATEAAMKLDATGADRSMAEAVAAFDVLGKKLATAKATLAGAPRIA